MRILFLGETYRADAQTWIRGIEDASGFRIETKEIPKTGGRLTRMLHAIQFLFALKFSKETYDVVLAERATSYGFFSLLVKAKVRIVAQQGVTDVWPSDGFAGWYKTRLQTSIYKKADLIHAWGHVMTFAMINTQASPTKILVRPKGLDLGKFRFTPPSQKNTNLAIVTRSLFPIYHHAEIVEAIALLKQEGIHVSCTMIGDGIEEENLKRKTQNLGLENQIHWLGRISNGDLPNYLQESAIYLAFPETEGVSASLFEAMACGCFPIVTDLPANRAFISSGVNGILVPPGDSKALKEAISYYMSNQPFFEAGICQNRAFIEQNCNLKVNMNDFFNRYQKLLNQQS